MTPPLTLAWRVRLAGLCAVVTVGLITTVLDARPLSLTCGDVLGDIPHTGRRAVDAVYDALPADLQARYYQRSTVAYLVMSRCENHGLDQTMRQLVDDLKNEAAARDARGPF